MAGDGDVDVGVAVAVADADVVSYLTNERDANQVCLRWMEPMREYDTRFRTYKY